MNLLSSFTAGLLLLNMVSLPLPLPRTEVSSAAFQKPLLNFQLLPEPVKENGVLAKVIENLQMSRYLLRSA